VKDEPRNKVVTFRLSAREFDSLKSACGVDQSSISAITRKTVLSWAEAQNAAPKVEQRLAEIDCRLDVLCKLLGQNRDQ
jgi:hypothetical protein